jgi:HEAT repeat-containing protein 5
MGRIFKLLVTGLESVAGSYQRCQSLSYPCSSLPDQSANTSIGDLKVLSANSQTMLRLSLLSAWAQLEVSSTEQPYLQAILQPYLARLTPLWLSSLQDFARLRFEPDISSSLSGGGGIGGQDLNELYAALNRETLLHFYQDVWLNLIDAVAVLVDKDSSFVFGALDKRGGSASEEDTNQARQIGQEINFREEPVAFFFILYGLAFEALVTQSRNNSNQTLKILQALQKILRPAVSGNAIYQDAVFDETMEMLDRLALTEGLEIQTALIKITCGLGLDHQAAQVGKEREEKLSNDVEQLFELTRVMTLILIGMIPTIDQSSSNTTRRLSDESVALVCTTLEALVDVAEVFPSVIRSDLYACMFHIFSSILATGACQEAVVPQTFPIFKRFLQSMTSLGNVEEMERLARGCLWQFLRVLMRAQRRENPSALSCAKNSLLALAILLTSVGTTLAPNEELVHQALDEILSCLHDAELGAVAANCLRSLLSPAQRTRTEEAIFCYLLPRILHFLVDDSVKDAEDARSILTRSLVTSAKSLPANQVPSLFVMIVPALLKRAASTGSGCYKEISGRLLELAAKDQTAFKQLVGRLRPEQHEYLETILTAQRERGGHSRQNSAAYGGEDGVDAKPSIALRMDF